MSYVTVPAEQASKLAQEALNRIQKARAIAEDLWVRKEVERINKGIWVRWGLRRPATPDQVTKDDLARGALYSEIFVIRRLRFGRQEDVAKQVLKAAKIGDPVNISLEDLEEIS